MLALFFCGLSLGFFIGRNFVQPAIQISTLPSSSTAATADSETEKTQTKPPAQDSHQSTSAVTTESEVQSQETQPKLPAQDSDQSTPAVATEPEAQLEETVFTESTDTAPEETGIINVNTADQQTLDQLPGIGEVLSQRIIEYREANGPFGSLQELINIKGIGQKRLEELLPFATVGG